ncbi:MAG: response regulator [Deltaproteobacteria bacterium GWA2_55_10]|nr:MAG: response regulator [Deltaproteobacteria bacterium GWA2_55_10]
MHDGSARPIEILMVEDNPSDIRLTIEAFRDAKVRNNLHVAYTGDEAMEFLRREGAHQGAPRPDLILLDLNLPGKSGSEVLEEIKGDPELKRIPVIVLTTSDNEMDIQRAYDLHANAYITKPVDLDKFIGIAEAVEDFWLSVAKLPAR